MNTATTTKLTEIVGDIIKQMSEADKATVEDFYPDADLIDIKGLDLSEILRAVSEKRIAEYPRLSEAAASLGIDARTLRGYVSDAKDSIEEGKL